MLRAALLAVLLTTACRTLPPATAPASAEPAAPPPAEVDPMRARLAALDQTVDRERARLGVPGAALVVVKDGEVIHLRGYGTRAVGSDAPAPVGPDTMFAIGSTTKAFTAMLVMMAVEAGGVTLEDHPRKCIPDFAIRGKGNASLTLRDLLTHSSGLPTADLAWSTGQLSAPELLTVLGEIEPVAGVREAFHYQNLGYLAAGTCAARALGGEYEGLLRARILEPIGMDDATLRVAQMQARADAAHGHHRGHDGKTHEVPMRALDAIAPAGGINASAQMLGGWLKLLLAGGVVDGKPLLARPHFDELLKPQIPAGPGVDYTLGWLRVRSGKDWYFTHTGGIDGFTAVVGFVPERGLGFAFVNNVDHVDLHGVVAHEVLALLEDPVAAPGAPAVASVDEVGTYGMLGGFRVEVVRDGDRIAMVVPGQPKYPLIFERDRHYRLGGAAPTGFAATFRPRKDDSARRELVLAQPFGDLVLPHLEPAEIAAAASALPPEDLRDMLGVYQGEGAGAFEVIASEGRVVLQIPGQPAMPLSRGEDDRLALAGLPPEYWVEAKRDGKAVRGLVLHKPDGDVAMSLVASTAPPSLPIERVLAKRAAAHGSAALAKRTTMRVESDLDFVHQGLRGRSVTIRASGDRWVDDVRLMGAGREIGRVRIGHDDGAAWQRISFAPTSVLEPLQAEAIALDAPFDGLGATAPEFSSATVWRAGKLGSRPVIVVRFATEWGAVVLDSYDAKSFLLLRRELDLPSDGDGGRLQETRTFGEYRRIKGVMVPHRVEVESVQGVVVARVTRVEFDVVLAPEAFTAPP